MRSFCVAALGVVILGCNQGGSGQVDLEDKTQRISYSIGSNIGASLLRDSIAIHDDAFLRGIKDAMGEESKRLLTKEEVEQTLMALQEELGQRRAAKEQARASENLKRGQEFLEANKNSEGVVTLPSGLQYRVLVEGKGASPRLNQTVVAHYIGTFIDGTEFDSSHKRGEPATFAVQGVIPGWTEALQLMKVGSKWRLFIPPALAYGENGAGDVIGPNQTLIFDVELLEIR